ncbi:MAG: lamin tail domain-containing protein [Chitinophagales bacterium]|nr:lamin tail domain-containing protein [Chitinophagales bacterium]
MKKIYFFIFILSIYSLGFGQATLPVSTTTLAKGALPTGFSHTGLGSDYSGPKLKFDTQGDELVLYFNGTAGVLTFDLGVNNSFTGTLPTGCSFTVYESSDGISYSALSTYVAGDALGTKTISAISASTSYIKWVYTLKPSGSNIALYNIGLTAGSASSCSLTALGLSSVTCNDNSTTAVATDDYITFDLNPTGSGLGSNYNVSVSSGTISPTSGTYGSATSFTLQNGSAGAGNVTITVTDATTSSCNDNVTVTDPGSCSANAPSVCLTDGFEDADGWANHGSGVWTETANAGTYSADGIYASTGASARGGSGRYIGFNDVGDWLELPPIDNPSSISYWASLSSTESVTNGNRIIIQVYNGSSWVDVIEHTCTSTTYVQFTANLSAYTSQTGVRIRLYRSADDRSHYIDDIEVTCGTPCTAPTTQATNVSINTITTTTANISWTNGNGNRRIVVVKAGSAVAGIPASGTSYTASTTFGTGGTIAADEYVVYDGTGTSVAVNGLACNTDYFVQVFEYNTADDCYLTTTSTNNPNSFTTLEAVINASVTSITGLNYEQGNGPSATQTFSISASNLFPLLGNITITAPTNFSISTDGISFSSSISVPYTLGSLGLTTYYVQLNAGLSAGTYTGDISIDYPGLPTACDVSETISCSGEVAVSACGDLYISEYVFGLNNDKAIEVYNPTASSINLSAGNYAIRIYYNGNITYSTYALSGTIPAYGTWVLAHSSASFAGTLADQTNGSLNFNGNDVVALVKGSLILDIFGNIGEDPGTEWTGGGNTTLDNTLVRIPTIQKGIQVNPGGTGFPTLATEWISVGFNETDYLGYHCSNCYNTNTIVTHNITLNEYCVTSATSSNIAVPFYTYGTYNAGNIFTAQLSDASGSFTSPINLGTLSLSGTSVSGTINGIIPAGTTSGTEYKIRVVASNPSSTCNYAFKNPITIYLAPVNPTLVTASSSGSGSIQVTWTNPACYDEMMVVMCTAAPVTTVPSGDGSNYEVANSESCLSNVCEEVVYKNTGNSITLNGLDNGTSYYFKVFTRKGTEWSSGVAVNGTPTGSTTLGAGEFAVIGMNSNDNDCGGGGGGIDNIYFVSFKDIYAGTTIDITDNGWSNCTAGKFNNTEGFYRVTYTGATIPAGTVIKWVIPPSGTPTTLATNWNVTDLGSNTINTNSGGDQLLFMQGGIWDNGTPNNHDATYTGGRYLFAFNTKTSWGAAPDCGSTPNRSQFSELPDGLGCYNQTPATGATDFFLYTGAVTTTDKYSWLDRLLNTSNWTAYSDCSNFNTALTAIPSALPIDNSSIVNTWTGAADDNWFNCENWSANLVPNQSVNVTIPNTTNKPNISAAAVYSDQFFDVANCKNLTIQNGAIVKVENNATNKLVISGNLIINSGGQLDADGGGTEDGTIAIAGDWTNNNGANGFLQGKSTVSFNGASTQNLTISIALESFYNLTIKKTAQTYLNLNDNIEVANTGVLNFACGGIIKTNAYKVTVNNPSIINAIKGYETPNTTGTYVNDKYVFGNLERNINTTGNYDFPVGDAVAGEAYNPVILNIASGSGYATAKFVAGDPGVITVPFTEVTCSGATNFVEYTDMTGEGWWNFVSSTGTTFSYDIYLHPNALNANTYPNDDVAGYKNNYRALKATTGTGGGTWPPSAAFGGDNCIVSNNYYEIIGAGYSGFSDFAPGGGSGNTTALPVELLSFSANCNNDGAVTLNWSTASEINSDKFIVEKSTDGIHFETLTTVHAAGFSTEVLNYSYIDNDALDMQYYRLKQIDFDGTVHTFNITLAKCGNYVDGAEIYYQSGVGIHANIQNGRTELMRFELYQLDGKLLFNDDRQIQQGYNAILLDDVVNQLAEGVYVFRIVGEHKTYTEKLYIK